jgi:hypothetical protein
LDFLLEKMGDIIRGLCVRFRLFSVLVEEN